MIFLYFNGFLSLDLSLFHPLSFSRFFCDYLYCKFVFCQYGIQTQTIVVTTVLTNNFEMYLCKLVKVEEIWSPVNLVGCVCYFI